MYIDILLALILVGSAYMLWRRVSEKIPDLELISDQDLSVLLEENTAKLQRFFLHLFHFRSFYRERHYHERFWSVVTKLLFKAHILLLRVDNGIIRLMKRMREGNAINIEQRHETREYFSRLHINQDVSSSGKNRLEGGENQSPSVLQKTNRIQEVRKQRRISFTETLGASKLNQSK